MYQTIVLLPLLGALIAGLFGRIIGHRAAEVITTAFMFVSAGLSILAFFQVPGGETIKVTLFTWIDSGTLEAAWQLRIDTLTAVMLVVVTLVSSLVHLYSIGYMSHDDGRARFFSYLSFFTFAMLALVTADNLLQLFFGWEGVGVASYLLIGFWFKKPSAGAAAIKAFVVNRVGDFGFLLGIFATFMVFDTIYFDEIFADAGGLAGQTFTIFGLQADILTSIALLLFIGAMGKSAQLFLHTWLPDAMEGPTPVSALIHAATMVTAGVFLVCRMSPVFEYAPTALAVVTVVGATTALFAATVGMMQNDIKRVIAYSTCSQLGYMFFAAGVGAYGVAMFHLFTHAFFKALLFLGAGAVIHALHDEQDMRKMGGLAPLMPLTYILMLMGTLSLVGFGIPHLVGFSGFYSKDAAIESAFAAGTPVGQYAFVMGVIAALLTSYYSFRLMFMTFHGSPRAPEETMKHAHDAPTVMGVPLIVLAVGAVLAGGVFYGKFVGGEAGAFWHGSLVAEGGHGAEAAGNGHAGEAGEAVKAGGHHDLPEWVLWTPLGVTLIGLVIAWFFYIKNPQLPGRMAARNGPIYAFLKNKWYFDELYNAVFVKPAMWLGRILWKGGDGRIIDGLGPNGMSALVQAVTNRVIVPLQSGYIYHYAFIMLIGVAGLVTYFTLRGL